jgi:hypothetical protein
MNDEMLINEGFEQNTEPTGPKKTGLATAALVLGILALVTTLIFINYIFGILALIFAIIYLCKKGKKSAKGRAITGLVLALVSIVISTCLYGGIYIYLTQTNITDIMEDVNTITGGEINPQEMINDAISSSIPDQTAIKELLGREIDYDLLCEFVGEEVSLQTILNFVGDDFDANEFATVLSETDVEAVINHLGGEITYKALEDKIGEDFTYDELKAYLEGFKRVQ